MSIIGVGIGIPFRAGGSSESPSLLFLDRFTSPSGVVSSPRVATPGTGKWTLANASSFEVIDGWLRKGGVIGETTWGDQRANGTDNPGAGISRVAGRTLSAVFVPEDRNADWFIGWVTATSVTNPRVDGHTIGSEDGFAELSIPSSKIAIVSDASTGYHTIRAQDYFIGVTLNDQGAVYWISTFETDTGGGMAGPLSIPKYPLARILYVTTSGTATPLYPSYYPFDTVDGSKRYYNGHALDNVRLSDPASWAGVADFLATFADRFTRADSTTTIGNSWTNDNGTWGITGNQAYLQTSGSFSSAFRDVASTSDGIFVWDLILQASNQNAYVAFRRTSAGNYLRLGTNSTNNSFVLQQVVNNGSAINTISSGPCTWNAGTNKVVVIASGNKYLIYINGVEVSTSWITDASNFNIAGTGIGAMMFNAGVGVSATIDNVAIYPHTFTLPADLQAYGDYIPPKAEGAATITDTFTGADATALAGRATTTGGQTWAQIGTPVWTISGNKAISDRTGEGLLYVTAPTDDYWVSVDVTVPGSWNAAQTMFVGLMLAGVDDNNYIFVREVADQLLQPQDDEIELVQIIAGTGGIEHKAQMGSDVYALNGTYTLKCHKITVGPAALIRVFLDGKPRVSYVAPNALVSGRRVGLYQSNFDSACKIDNFQVGPLT
jgi:hypothetical protein